nr:isoform 2 of protein abhd12b [Quercus suber]
MKVDQREGWVGRWCAWTRWTRWPISMCCDMRLLLHLRAVDVCLSVTPIDAHIHYGGVAHSAVDVWKSWPGSGSRSRHILVHHWTSVDACASKIFGFSKNQVTPFNLHTPDGETLYAWHVLPLDAYARHERSLREQERPHAPVEDFTNTSAFSILTGDDPTPAKPYEVHGNAGHIAQGWRTDTFRYLATQPNTHVFSIDYRGFGHSTGSPSEAGLITDGTALVNWILQTCNIPPERILIIGQSLGTAVSTAVALHFADPDSELIPTESRELRSMVAREAGLPKPIAFMGVILVAPFSSVPSLLLTYRLGGLIPLLLPLRPFPGFARWLTSYMIDKWPSADRLAAYYNTLAGSKKLLADNGRSMASLQIIHAVDDRDITYHQTEYICQRIFGNAGVQERDVIDEDEPVQCIDGSHGPTVLDVKREARPRVRFEILGFGGEYYHYKSTRSTFHFAD